MIISKATDEPPYFGCVVGVYGNRIKDGKFELDGNQYQVTTNSEAGGAPVHLHGGDKGLDKVLWSARPIVNKNSALLVLNYIHPDGAEGYPGNIRIRVVYRLTNENALEVAYRATTDKTTVINLTHHSYFNLNGEVEHAFDHELMINNHITPITAQMVPTGESAVKEPRLISQSRANPGIALTMTILKSASGADMITIGCSIAKARKWSWQPASMSLPVEDTWKYGRRNRASNIIAATSSMVRLLAKAESPMNTGLDSV